LRNRELLPHESQRHEASRAAAIPPDGAEDDPLTDAVLEACGERIRAASLAKSPLAIRGGGTKDFYGEASVGRVRHDRLDVSAYAGIVDYDPTELVVTARAGTRLSEVVATLRASGQMLAGEPPAFGANATLGGAVAAGLSGPRRPYAGAMRDIVLGVRMFDGRGQDLSFGGRVMKNVAGFDLSRLLTGSLGTLGVLTEISLKCIPLPNLEATRVLECGAADALRMTNEWIGKPLPISATCHRGHRLAVRLSGAAPAVEAAARQIGGSLLADGDAFWEGIREQTDPWFAAASGGNAPLWRISVKASAPYRELGGEQMIEWSGALRWLVANDRAEATAVRAYASENGGHATLFRAADKAAGAFHPLPETLLVLHRRLKAQFDPDGILNPGRLYPGL
jgi:glycolate oxidase FAD binding subunit